MARIKRDDKVLVIAGKDKGKKGRVLRLAKGGERAFVEKLNMVKRHSRPSQQNPQGGIIDKEASIHISNLMLLTKNDQAVRVRYEFRDVDGKSTKVRIAAQTGDALD
jgi:large subunit ribosomal protein L24